MTLPFLTLQINLEARPFPRVPMHTSRPYNNYGRGQQRKCYELINLQFTHSVKLLVNMVINRVTENSVYTIEFYRLFLTKSNGL